MLKRILPLLVALIIVIGTVVGPVSVSAASVYDGDDFHPLLTFDSIYGGAGYSLVSWPFNSVRLGCTDSDSAFSIADDLLRGALTTQATDLARMEAWFYYPAVAGSVGSEETMTLKHDSSFVVYREGLRPEGAFDISTDTDDLDIVRVRVSGYFSYMDKTPLNDTGKEVYFKNKVPFNMTFGTKDGVAPIGEYLYQAIESCEFLDEISYPMVENFTVELDVVRRDVDTPKFYVAAILTSDTYGVSDWMSCYSLTDSIHQPSGGEMDLSFNWLASVVDGFLDVEFLPNFSFNELIYAVVVVGFVLWFIKVIS